MNQIILKQIIPLRQKLVVGLPIIALGIVTTKENLIISLVLLLIGLMVFGLSYYLIITKPFGCFYSFKIFKIQVFKLKKKLFFPDYISLFHQSFVQPNNAGFSPKIISDTRYKDYTIKFFKNNKNVIIYQSENKEKTISLGTQLSNLLDVELYNTLN